MKPPSVLPCHTSDSAIGNFRAVDRNCSSLGEHLQLLACCTVNWADKITHARLGALPSCELMTQQECQCEITCSEHDEHALYR